MDTRRAPARQGGRTGYRVKKDTKDLIIVYDSEVSLQMANASTAMTCLQLVVQSLSIAGWAPTAG